LQKEDQGKLDLSAQRCDKNKTLQTVTSVATSSNILDNWNRRLPLGKEKGNVCQCGWTAWCPRARMHVCTQVREYLFFLLPFAARCPITCLECYFHFAVRASLHESEDRLKVQRILQSCVMNPRVPPIELYCSLRKSWNSKSWGDHALRCVMLGVKCGEIYSW